MVVVFWGLKLYFYWVFGGGMLKIYVLTKGCYSDYHIITATTDYELACKIKDRFDMINSEWSDEKVNIEIYEDAEIYLKPNYFIRFDKQGNVVEAYEDTSEYGYDRYSGLDVKGGYFTTITTDNKESAIKIAAEKRAMFLAEKEGIN